MKNKNPRYKRPAVEDVDPTPHKKASRKTPPKKANHQHMWRPIILEYWNDSYSFSKEKGFEGGYDQCGGRECVLCKKRRCGFPTGFDADRFRTFFPSKAGLTVRYPMLEVVRVKDIWKLI